MDDYLTTRVNRPETLHWKKEDTLSLKMRALWIPIGQEIIPRPEGLNSTCETYSDKFLFEGFSWISWGLLSGQQSKMHAFLFIRVNNKINFSSCCRPRYLKLVWKWIKFKPKKLKLNRLSKSLDFRISTKFWIRSKNVKVTARKIFYIVPSRFSRLFLMRVNSVQIFHESRNCQQDAPTSLTIDSMRLPMKYIKAPENRKKNTIRHPTHWTFAHL